MRGLPVALGVAGALLCGGMRAWTAPAGEEPPPPKTRAEVLTALTTRPGVLINIHSGLFPATWDLTLLGQKATPALRKALLGNTSSDVRWRAAQVLTQLRDSSALPELHQAVTDWNPSVRNQVMRALGWVGNAYSVPYLRKRVQDPQETLANRIAAIDALGNIGDASAEADLVKAYADAKEEPSVRRAAVNAFWALRRAVLRGHLVAFFRKALADKDPYVVRRAAIAIGALRDGGALPALYKHLVGSNAMLRNVAAYVIGRIGDKRAIGELERAIGTVRSGRLLNNIAFALQRLGAPKLWDHLQRLLTHPQAFIRLNAAFTTGEMRLTQALPILVKLLHDRNVAVRAQALVALAKIRDPRSVPEVLKLLSGKGAKHRRLALKALLYLSGQKRLRDRYLSLSTSDKYRREAALVLAARGDRRAAPLLYPLIRRRRDRQGWRAAGALKDPLLIQLLTAQLKQALRVGDVSLLPSLLSTLGPARTRGQAKPLVGLLFSKWSRLDQKRPPWLESLVAVIRALGYSGDANVRRWLAPYAHHKNYHARMAARVALARLGDDAALRSLVAALRNASDHHRPYLAARLGELSVARLRSALGPALRDPDPYVQLAVGAALFYAGDVTNRQIRSALRSQQAALRDRARYYLSRHVDTGRFHSLKRLRAAAADPQAQEELDRLLATYHPRSAIFRAFVPMEVVLY